MSSLDVLIGKKLRKSFGNVLAVVGQKAVKKKMKNVIVCTISAEVHCCYPRNSSAT